MLKKMALPVIPEDSSIEYQRDTICIMIDTDTIQGIDDIESPCELIILMIFTGVIVALTVCIFMLIQ